MLGRNERHILLILAIEGPKSILSLRKKIKESKLELRGISTKHKHSLHDPQARRAVDELEKRGLVRTIAQSRQPKKMMVALTFHGLFWYLKYAGENSKIRERIKDVFRVFDSPQKKKRKLSKRQTVSESAQGLLPFITQWDYMTKRWEDKCYSRMIETIDSFLISEEKLDEVKTLGIQLETFQRSKHIIKLDKIGLKEDYYLERNSDVATYLMSTEAKLLKEAYIAFLLKNDIHLLSSLDDNEVEKKLPKLKSFKEFTHFEGTKSSLNNFFSNEGLNRFFPKYSGIEYYFTGNFVCNMLWDKEPFNNYYYEI